MDPIRSRQLIQAHIHTITLATANPTYPFPLFPPFFPQIRVSISATEKK